MAKNKQKSNGVKAVTLPQDTEQVATEQRNTSDTEQVVTLPCATITAADLPNQKWHIVIGLGLYGLKLDHEYKVGTISAINLINKGAAKLP